MFEDAVVVVVDELTARPDGFFAVRKVNLPASEGVEPLVVGGSVRHVRGDYDAIAVIERYEAAVEGTVVERVEQEPV